LDTLFLVSVLALVASWTLVWAMLRFIAHGLPLDAPNERSLHTAPTPRVGGLAIVLTVTFALGWLAWQPVVLACAVALALVSFLDDRSGLPTLVRFGAHLLAAAVSASWLIGLANPVWTVAIVLAVVWMTNLFNFMDGSDGLAGGMALFGFCTYAIGAWLQGDALLATASIAIAAAALGFLAFNFHPAKVFMGDAGSIPLGFLAAGIGILGWRDGRWPIWLPIVAFSPFIVDASVTLARRLLRGERVWEAHRTHYYQRLVQLGWGHRRTALAEYCLMALCGGAALWGMRASMRTQLVLLAALAVLYGALALGIDRAWARHLTRRR
jgi:UDP-N-acetylmuramyl pentapeptide phosphotransferase/UDP-N-acetylglucosamine-1-phosphate transferase